LAPSSGKKFSDNPLLFGNYAPGYVDKNGYAKLRGKVVLHFDVFAKMIFKKQNKYRKMCIFAGEMYSRICVYQTHIHPTHIHVSTHLRCVGQRSFRYQPY